MQHQQQQWHIWAGMEERLRKEFREELAVQDSKHKQKIELKDNQISALAGRVDQLEQVNSFQLKIKLCKKSKVNKVIK